MSFQIYASTDVWLPRKKYVSLLFDYSSVPVPVNPSFLSLFSLSIEINHEVHFAVIEVWYFLP